MLINLLHLIILILTASQISQKIMKRWNKRNKNWHQKMVKSILINSTRQFVDLKKELKMITWMIIQIIILLSILYLLLMPLVMMKQKRIIFKNNRLRFQKLKKKILILRSWVRLQIWFRSSNILDCSLKPMLLILENLRSFFATFWRKSKLKLKLMVALVPWKVCLALWRFLKCLVTAWLKCMKILLQSLICSPLNKLRAKGC